MEKIGIIGMGLIGTSLGLAMKQAGMKNVQIVGTDKERGHSSKAQRMGAIDRAERNMMGAVENAQMVIIATPVMATKEILEIIGPRLQDGCLVTDTGGSKGVVMEWAEQYLPQTVSFVGGHPMVGKEESGPEAADAFLFQNRAYCVIPAKRADRDAVKLLTEMITTIGAKAYFIDVAEHDSFVCAVSHLPTLLSVALIGCTSKSPSWSDIAQVATTQYGEITSPASNEPITNRDLFFSADEGIVHWIDSFISELQEIRQILAVDGEGKLKALEKVFTQAFEARNRWLVGAVTPGSHDATKPYIPSSSETFTSLFTGDSSARRRVFGWGEGRDKDARRDK